MWYICSYRNKLAYTIIDHALSIEPNTYPMAYLIFSTSSEVSIVSEICSFHMDNI